LDGGWPLLYEVISLLSSVILTWRLSALPLGPEYRAGEVDRMAAKKEI